ncbi:acyl-CoA dehydrogenase [Rhodoligotrophos ferricapiens]|uniref:acyl-CoA dehydrogenase n=1 Tax=Rhodoligotrophos ferricapiens TaxID=3069264 RepID=UPI00315DA6D5
MTDPAMKSDNEMSAILAEQADRLFTQWVTTERLAAADRGEWQQEIWQAIEEAGLPLALLPEEQGGIGLEPLQAFRLIRQAAYYAAPVPLGETMIAMALWGEPLSGPVSVASGSLTGAQRVLSRVPFARNVEQVLVHLDGDRLALLPLGQAKLEHDRNLANEPRDQVNAEGWSPAEDAVRSSSLVGEHGLLPHGALVRAMQMCGAMHRAIDLALTHANERRQFGRPIGKFQAVQHMLAEGAGHVAAACAIADNAAEAWGKPDFAFAVALAKSRVGEAAGRVAAITHQVHAAMGFTQEHSLHFSTRRLWSWRDEFGAEPYWEEWIGRLVCAKGGEALWDSIVEATSRSAA